MAHTLDINAQTILISIFFEPPDDDNWEEVIKNFDLSKTRAEQLCNGVVEIVKAINKNIAFDTQVSKGRDRTEILKYFHDISKPLEKLETTLTNSDPNSNKTLSIIFSRELAELLGNRGLAHLLPGHPKPHPPTIHDLDSHDAESRDGLYDALDDVHYIFERESIAQNTTHILLQRLAGALNTPLAKFLEIERQAKGGNPGRRYLNYVIQQLAILYQDIFEKEPTRTRPGRLSKNTTIPKTGQFVLLCELVLSTLDMDTGGVESAVDRTLSRLDL